MKNPFQFPPFLFPGIIVLSLSILSFSFLDKKALPTNQIIQKLKEKLNIYNQQLPEEKIYLQFDKPFYKPGDDIWFSAYLRDGRNNKASSLSEILNVELINPKGNVEKTLRLVAEDGKAAGDFNINAAAPGGLYKVKAYTNWMKNSAEDNYFEKELQVQAVVLPRLLMKLDFERKAYGAGDEVTAKINLATLSNKPLSNYNFSFLAQVAGKELTRGKGKTDENGLAYASFYLPKKLESNDGLLNIVIAHEGSQESISRSIPIVLNQIDLQFFPEGGDLIQDVESKVAFKALNEFGKPADIEGIILDEKNQQVGDFKSFHQGMGAFEFKPEGTKRYTAKITKPEGIEKIYVLPSPLSNGYRLLVTAQEKEEASIKIYAPFNTTLVVIVQVRGEIYFSKEIKAKQGENLMSIPLNGFPAGVAQVTVFDQKSIARCERLLFVNQHQQLKVEVATNKEKYLPREKVEMTIKVRDENGLPVPGQFSLSVVDDKLISFADDKQANILSYLLLNSDLKGKVEEPNFYFDKEEPKAAVALDHLLMTQGWRRFEWEQVLDAHSAGLQKQVKHAAEKAIVKGKVVKFKDNTPAVNTKVTVLETEEVTYTDSDGKFEFKNLDLSTPRTLQVLDEAGKEQIIQINDYAQEYLVGGNIRGKIVSKSDGLPLPGVNVYFKGTTIGTKSDIEGDFSIPATEARRPLIINFIGFKTQEINTTGKGMITVEMEVDRLKLEEVVVIGFGAQNKRAPMEARAEARQPQAVEVAFDQVDQEEKAVAFQDADMAKAEVGVPAPDMIMDIAENEIEEIVFEEVAEWDREEEIGDEIFAIVEDMPEYPGGMTKLYEQVTKNIEYPRRAMQLGIEGKVYVQFIILEDGSIADVSTIKGVGAGCDEEAERVIKSLPKWKPGRQRGNPVKTRMVLPIIYDLEHYEKYQTGLMFQVAANASYDLKTETPKYYRARNFYTPVYKADEQVEIRTDFRKTIYWNPDIEIDKTGTATVSFYNSDEVTTFRATIEGIADEGMIGRNEHTYFTQLPFSLDTKIPAVLAFEDKVSIPVKLKNNTNKKVTGDLKIEAPKQLHLINNFGAKISIPANSVKTLFMDYEVLSTEAGKGSLRFTFEADGFKDSFEQPIEIKAKGFPAVASFSGNESSKTYNLEIRDMVKNSLTAKLTAYPDVLTDLMAGIESILREPYGCFEQTSSATYPNILVLQYLETSGTNNPQARQKAEALIEKGYNKLVSFETSDKGYEWFGSTPPHEGLTAYGLMEFKDMEKVYASVDDKMVRRTTNWLLDRRDGQGSFKRSSQSLDEFGRASEAVNNAYIVYALSEAEYKDIDKEVQLAVKTAIESKDAYQMALVSNALFNLGKSKEAEDMVKKLTDMINKNGLDNLEADHSITRSTGKSLQVETVSLVAMALLKSQHKDLKTIQETINYLVKSRSNYGGFGSTQATILALKALTGYAEFSKRTASSGTIELLVDGKLVVSHYYEKGTQGEILIEGLEKFIRAGSKNIKVQFTGTKDPLPYSVDLSWSTYTPVDSKECKVALGTKLSKNTGKVGETIRLTVSLANKSDEGLPMTIALIGIPSGLSVQPWQLKELLDKKKVDFYEVDKNYLVIYYRQMAPGVEQVINLDLKSEIPGIYEAPASSAYLYYTNEHKVWSGGERVVINN